MRSLLLAGLLFLGQGGAVSMVAHAPVARGVDAFPRVGDGVSAPVAAKINLALDRLDAKVLASAKDCRAEFRQGEHKDDEDAWGRTVTVTMAGPRFVSYLVADEYYCGGAYPNAGTFPIVYDLQTGSPVNWAKFLPAAIKTDLSESPDGSKIGVVIWPVLTQLAKKQATRECQDVFDGEEGNSFVLWLDAKSKSIYFAPSDLPHAIAACGDPVALTAQDAAKLGFSAEVVKSLQAVAR